MNIKTKKLKTKKESKKIKRSKPLHATNERIPVKRSLFIE